MSIKSKYITSIGKTLTRDVMKPLKTALSCNEFYFNFFFNKKIPRTEREIFWFVRFFTVHTEHQKEISLVDGIYGYYGR